MSGSRSAAQAAWVSVVTAITRLATPTTEPSQTGQRSDPCAGVHDQISLRSMDVIEIRADQEPTYGSVIGVMPSATYRSENQESATGRPSSSIRQVLYRRPEGCSPARPPPDSGEIADVA